MTTTLVATPDPEPIPEPTGWSSLGSFTVNDSFTGSPPPVNVHVYISPSQLADLRLN